MAVRFTLTRLFAATLLAAVLAAGYARYGIVGALLVVSAAALFVLGMACVCSALAHRRIGWLAGAIWGGLFVLLGLLALGVCIFRWQ